MRYGRDGLPGIYSFDRRPFIRGWLSGYLLLRCLFISAEVSPAKSRGMFVAMFQLMITIGLLVSYLSDLYFADETSVHVGGRCFMWG